jgi:hypothetical protein
MDDHCLATTAFYVLHAATTTGMTLATMVSPLFNVETH